MSRRHALRIGALVWAAIGAAVALMSLRQVNADVRLFVGVLSLGGPLAAVWAARLLAERGRDRSAGALLLVSVLTPTYFFYVLNLPALLAGLLLVSVPRAILRVGHPRGTDAQAEAATAST